MALTLNGSTNTIAGLAVGGLPDGSVDSDTLASSAKKLTTFDCWRVTTAWSDSANPIVNWERSDSTLSGSFGSQMTESSGIFSFPSTGIWWVLTHIYQKDNGNAVYAGHDHNLTTDDGSNWVVYAESYSWFTDHTMGAIHDYTELSSCYDITDVSNQKIKFRTGGTANFIASTTTNYSFAQFLRLGDT
tara:strand:+ start:80 stop:643 length:564 start_codon:yes stop_codon:yes gene_type:complete